jgi:hypothetical protein
MSRAKIGLVVALVVAGLTATAYVLTTSSLEKRIKGDVEKQVARARDLLDKNVSFASLDMLERAKQLTDGLATKDNPEPLRKRLLAALDAKDPEGNPSPKLRSGQAYAALTAELERLRAEQEKKPEGQREPVPDVMAVVDQNGDVIALSTGGEFSAEWKQWGRRFPAVARALKEGKSYKDIHEIEENDPELSDVAVAPIIENDDAGASVVRGALVLAYTLDVKDAEQQARLLGTQVAWFDGGKLRGSSFGGGAAEEAALKKVLFDQKLADKVLGADGSGYSEVVPVSIGGKQYLASAVALPMNVSGRPAGGLVLMSLSDVMAPVSSVKLTILLLGLGALVIAILAMLFTARVILTPAEEIELGVTEIINGNIDYTFKPAGADFDGLANALNVMLARILGRPEPGEEEYDEDGNVATGSSKVMLDEAAAPTPASSAPDAETLALANEPEADYYRRIFNEYIAARRGVGENVDGVTYEGFVAKLRLNEGTLKKKYSCRAVRFRVQSKDGQVTLKPVPIV